MCLECDNRLWIDLTNTNIELLEVQQQLRSFLLCLAGLHGRPIPTPFDTNPNWIYTVLHRIRMRLYNLHIRLSNTYTRYICYEVMNRRNLWQNPAMRLKMQESLNVRRRLGLQIDDYRVRLTNTAAFSAERFYSEEGKILKLLIPVDEDNLLSIFADYNCAIHWCGY